MLNLDSIAVVDVAVKRLILVNITRELVRLTA